MKQRLDEFELLAVQATGIGKGYWKISRLGRWLYVFDAYEGTDGEIYAQKSKSGKPFMMRVHQDSLDEFIKFLKRVQKIINRDDPDSAAEGLPASEDEMPF